MTRQQIVCAVCKKKVEVDDSPEAKSGRCPACGKPLGAIASPLDAPWYAMKGKEQVGPYSPEQLRGRLASGELPMDGMIWREGMPKWVRVKTIPALLPAAPDTTAPAGKRCQQCQTVVTSPSGACSKCGYDPAKGMQNTAPPPTTAPEEEWVEVEPLKRKKKRKRKGDSWLAYYGTFFVGYLSVKNAVTLVFVLIGCWVVSIAVWFVEKAGVMNTPLLIGGFGMIVLSLAIRFVFYAD
jgi:hypothetical protein